MRIKVITTPTCIKCRELKPLLEEIRGKKDLDLIVIDANENLDFCRKHNVSSVPFIMFCDNEDNVLSTHVGFITEKELLDIIK